jgi:hypothetical protein
MFAVGGMVVAPEEGTRLEIAKLEPPVHRLFLTLKS